MVERGGWRPRKKEAAFKAGSKGEKTSRREKHSFHILAQDFTYKDIEELPAGVNAKQYDFLRDAAEAGAFHLLLKTNQIDTFASVHMYFTTEATYADIARKFGWIKGDVRGIVRRGMRKLRRELYKRRPDLAQEDRYPLKEIQKGKNARGSRSRIKRDRGTDIYGAKPGGFY